MDGCSLQGIRPERTRWKREAMDQDNAGHRVVRILPHLRPEKPAFDGSWKPGDFEVVN